MKKAPFNIMHTYTMWLGHWTCNQEVAGSSPGHSGQRLWASCSHTVCLRSQSSINWYRPLAGKVTVGLAQWRIQGEMGDTSPHRNPQCTETGHFPKLKKFPVRGHSFDHILPHRRFLDPPLVWRHTGHVSQTQCFSGISTYGLNGLGKGD